MEVIRDSIWNDIIAEVKQAKLHSVIADEVADTAYKEELSLSLCFVFEGRVKEVFVDFVEVEQSLQSRHQRSVLQWCVQYVWSGMQDVSPLCNKRPHWYCTFTVPLIV